MAVSIYELFSTDSNVEKEGFELCFGDAKIRIARAGGANLKFARVLETKTRPYRRQMEAEKVNDETQKLFERLAAETFAETVVLGWENLKDRDGNLIVYSVENCIQLFTDLPDFFTEIRTQASKFANFKSDDTSGDVKN